MTTTGRPLKYETEEELQEAVDAYFLKCANADPQVPLTITGLAYELGFESRQSIYDYEKKGAFSYTIKRARLYIESSYEGNLHKGAPAGSIFALKNFGWRDQSIILEGDFEPTDEFL